MANSIALVTKYTPILDEVYKKASLTGDLVSNNVQFDGANAVKILKVATGNLNDYARNTGFTASDSTITWETKTLAQDRGTEFNIDAMDNEETLDQAFMVTMSQFIRIHAVPEIDAYRLNKIYTNAGTKVAAALTTGADVLAAIETAEEKMNDDEVPFESRVLYITPAMYGLLKTELSAKGGLQRIVASTVNMNFTDFDGMEVRLIPSARFNTTVTITATASGGGYTATGKTIDFMIVDKQAVIGVEKHVRLRVFTPDQNQNMDAYKFQYRIYHDCFVYDNKVKGIYAHTPVLE